MKVSYYFIGYVYMVMTDLALLPHLLLLWRVSYVFEVDYDEVGVVIQGCDPMCDNNGRIGKRRRIYTRRVGCVRSMYTVICTWILNMLLTIYEQRITHEKYQSRTK